jgi:hypothetical protein
MSYRTSMQTQGGKAHPGCLFWALTKTLVQAGRPPRALRPLVYLQLHLPSITLLPPLIDIFERDRYVFHDVEGDAQTPRLGKSF